MRLHGRNAEAYNAHARSAGERFDYDYSDEELRGLAAEVVRLSYKVRKTHVIFNNCDLDKGQRNGMTAMTMLAEQESKPRQPGGFNAANGMLAALNPSEITAAIHALPPPGDESTPVDVDVETRVGLVRVTVAPQQAQHHKHRHWFWSAVFARPI